MMASRLGTFTRIADPLLAYSPSACTAALRNLGFAQTADTHQPEGQWSRNRRGTRGGHGAPLPGGCCQSPCGRGGTRGPAPGWQRHRCHGRGATRPRHRRAAVHRTWRRRLPRLLGCRKKEAHHSGRPRNGAPQGHAEIVPECSRRTARVLRCCLGWTFGRRAGNPAPPRGTRTGNGESCPGANSSAGHSPGRRGALRFLPVLPSSSRGQGAAVALPGDGSVFPRRLGCAARRRNAAQERGLRQNAWCPSRQGCRAFLFRTNRRRHRRGGAQRFRQSRPHDARRSCRLPGQGAGTGVHRLSRPSMSAAWVRRPQAP